MGAKRPLNGVIKCDGQSDKQTNTAWTFRLIERIQFLFMTYVIILSGLNLHVYYFNTKAFVIEPLKKGIYCNF